MSANAVVRRVLDSLWRTTMRAFRRVCVVVAALLATPAAGLAQNADQAQELRNEIAQLKKDFDARLAALEAKLAAVPAGTAPQAATTAAPAPGAPQAPPTAPAPAQPSAQV